MDDFHCPTPSKDGGEEEGALVRTADTANRRPDTACRRHQRGHQYQGNSESLTRAHTSDARRLLCPHTLPPTSPRPPTALPVRAPAGPTLAIDGRARAPLSSWPGSSNATTVVGPDAGTIENPPGVAGRKPRRGEMGHGPTKAGGARDLIAGHELGCAARIDEKGEGRMGI